jgi:hypothetical protein
MPVSTRSTIWTRATFAWLSLTWIGLACILVRMPFQVSDNLGNLLALRNVSLWSLVRAHFDGGQYMRPLLWGYFKVVFDLSHGHYFVAYKAVELAQIGLLLWLFARLLAVRTRTDFLVVPFVATVLVGLHTFGGFVWENYPINAYVTIAVFVLAALNLAESKGGWLSDLSAVLILTVAMFMVESGLLVWVALTTAYLAGARGVSRRGILVSTMVCAAYLLLRFAVLSGGAPGLDERSTGFGFRALDPRELQARFGNHILWFYASNTLSSMSSLLFSEPRYGVWEFTRALVTADHEVEPWMMINVLTSSVTTAVIVSYSIPRLRRWVRLDVAPRDRLVVVFWGLACANAVLGYAYNKDQIISVAGCVYPLAAFVAIRWLVDQWPALKGHVRAVVLIGMACASAGWVVRTVGLHYVLHGAAYRHCNDWTSVDKWLEERQRTHDDPAERAFVLHLRDEALRMRVPHPSTVYGRWGDRYFDQHP